MPKISLTKNLNKDLFSFFYPNPPPPPPPPISPPLIHGFHNPFRLTCVKFKANFNSYLNL